MACRKRRASEELTIIGSTPEVAFDNTAQFDHIFGPKSLESLAMHGRVSWGSYGEAGGVLFYVHLVKTGDEVGIEVAVNTERVTTAWTAGFSVTIKLSNEVDETKSISKKAEAELSGSDNRGPLVVPIISYSTVMKPSVGFLKNSSLTFEISFTIRKSTLAMPSIKNELKDELSVINDVLLSFDDGEKLAVSRSLLALHSPYFNTMFFKNFKECDQDCIELHGVAGDDFRKLMLVVYPSAFEVDEENIAVVLKMASLFNFPQIMRTCDRFLADSDSRTVSQAQKVLWTSQYTLTFTEMKLGQTLKTLGDIRSITRSELYKNEFDNDARSRLMEFTKVVIENHQKDFVCSRVME